MSIADKIALTTVILAVTPMVLYFVSVIGAAIIISIYGEKP